MQSTAGERERVEQLLDRLEESIVSLQSSVRQSVIERNYLEADEKQRELIRLKQFYNDKQAELKHLEAQSMESTAKGKLAEKIRAIERIYQRKMEILNNHVALVNSELKRKQGDEFLCKQEEFELVKPHLVHNNPDTAALRRGEYNAAKSGQYGTANRYRTVLENDKLKVIPKEDVNDLWKQERAKLMLRQENERNAVIECKDKIEKKERTTMKKQLDVTKEKYKLHRFDNFYKGDQGISFDEEEFLRYINRGPLRLRHHKAKLPYYQELSRSIDSTSRKSYRDSSLDKSTDRSNFNYDQHDTHSSMSPRKPARKIISVNTLSDSKVSHGSKYRPTDDNTRDDGKVSLIDWTDAVFVVPKGNKPRYLNKHVYDVDPSPIFDPATSNKPRESSQERADKVIRYFDEATGRSSRESSPGKSPIKQSRKSPIRQSRKNPNDDLKNGVSRKNGQNSNSARSDKSNSDKKGSSTSKHQKQSQREASQTGGIKDQSEIDIYYEEEDDEIDPNTAALALKASQSGTIIVIKDKLTGKESLQVNHKTTGDQEIATSPILEPAFETSEIFQALSDYVTQIKMEESSTFEPAFETREVYEALSSFVIGIKVPDTSSLEPAFETKEIFSALSTFVTEMQVPNIEPAFESSDIYQALAKFVNEIEVKTVEPAFESREVYEALAKFVTEIKVKSVEPAFESRDLFKALTSIARPTQQKPGEVAEPAPKTQAASETRAFLRAFKGLSGLKVSQPPSDSHAVTKEVIDSPDFKTKVIRRVQATINPSSAE